MTPEEKKSRIIRQIAIFGTVAVLFIGYCIYRLNAGGFG